MSNTNKQIPSPDSYLTEADWVKAVVKYTLEQAAEKGLVLTRDCYEPFEELSRDYFYFMETDANVSVDKQSILSLESQIIKDLGL